MNQQDQETLKNWLESVELEQYLPNFIREGISPQEFIALTVQDYQALGIARLLDKQKLFRLITTLKKQEAEQAQAAPPPPPPPPPPQQQQQRQQQTRSSDKGDFVFKWDQVIQQQQQDSQDGDAVPYDDIADGADTDADGQDYEGDMGYDDYDDASPAPPQIQQRELLEETERASDLLAVRHVHPNFDPDRHPAWRIRGIPTIEGTVLPDNGEFLRQIGQRIRVVVRKRPLLAHELQYERNIVTCDAWNQCSVHEPKTKVDLTKYTEVHQFRFDQVFNENSRNEEIYEYTAKPLITDLFLGRRTTCFAYGQTGSGKTHTMMEKETGIYVLAARDIFKYVSLLEERGPEALLDALGMSKLRVGGRPVKLPPKLEVYVAFFEIYGGNLFDLLNNRNRLFAREDTKGKVHVAGLQERRIESFERLFKHIDYGLSSRATGCTSVNADSSRSHAILQVILRLPPNQDALRQWTYSTQQTAATGEDKPARPVGRQYGKISFIDLAGSERAADTMNSDRQTRMEGAEINRSLLALKECIRALDRQASYTSFRGSKLTMVLKDSFIGETKTVMIANISPNDKSSENTLNTLRYADRVKEISARAGGIGSGAFVPVLKLTETPAEVVLGPDMAIDPSRPAAGSGSHSRGSRQKQTVASDGHQSHRSQSQQQLPASQSQNQSGPSHRVPSISQQSQQGQERGGYGGGRPKSTERSSSPESSAQDELARTHQAIVDKLYYLEDEIIQEHRHEVDVMMTLVKREVSLLHSIEQAEIPMDSWISQLSDLLRQKQRVIAELQEKVDTFMGSLRQEEDLSRSRTLHSP